MLTVKHLGHYKDLALLLTRYGLRDFRAFQSGPIVPEEPADDKPVEPDVKARAEAFARSLKEMGPAFIKFGQVLSTRPDIVPMEYITALQSFQDKLEPFPFEQVKETIESELGVPLTEAFKHFDEEPIAAASLGQVHRAELHNGKEAAVKVRRPGIREAVLQDMDVLSEIAAVLERHTDLGRRMSLTDAVNQFRLTIMSELNYLQEARNMFLFSRSLEEFTSIKIPKVYDELTTGKVLTAEFVHGTKLSKGVRPPARADRSRLASTLIRAYLKQVGIDGFWHCDPHPGNVFLKGTTLILIDFGMVARIGEELQNQIMKFLLSETGSEMADVCIEMGTPLDGFDREKFAREISQVRAYFHGLDFRQTSTGQMMFQIIGVAGANGLRLPSEVSLTAKTLLHLDGITKTLDPDLDPAWVIRHYAETLVSKKIRRQLQPRNFYTAFLDISQFLMELPRRSRGLLQQLSMGRAGITLKMSQADDMLNGLQKIANRVTIGLITASLIVGSSLVLRIESSYTIQGYPVFAIVGYAIAGVLGCALIVSSFSSDSTDRSKTKSKLK